MISDLVLLSKQQICYDRKEEKNEQKYFGNQNKSSWQ